MSKSWIVMSRNMPPGRLDIGRRRRRRVATDDVQQVRRADLARGHGRTYAREVRVESPVEPDLELHAGLRHRRQRFVDPVEGVVHRLLAEDVLARPRRLADQPRVRVR